VRMRAMYLSAIVIALSALVLAGCSRTQGASSSPSSQPSQPAQSTPQGTQPQSETSATTHQPAQQPTQSAPAAPKLVIKDTKVGKGKAAKAGDTVVVEYTGWLADGTKFDASADHGGTFTFPLGAGQVIPGWDQGVVGMKVGGVRMLTIPPELGYGAEGAGSTIPPNSTLLFQIKLVKIQ